MVDLNFEKPKQNLEFEKPQVPLVFEKPLRSDGSSPDPTPTVDPRLTRLPIYVNAGCSASIYITAITGTNAFYWLLPDGTEQHGVAYPTYTAPQGSGPQVIYCMCEEGHTLAEASNIHYLGDTTYGQYPYSYIKTEDMVYLGGITGQCYAFPTLISMVGDIKYIGNLVGGISSAVRLGATYDRSLCYGSMDSWPPFKGTSFFMDYAWSVSGSLKFIDDSPCYSIRMRYTTGMSGADLSQTFVNWDNANADTFGRSADFRSIKRSELTAEGEAAVVSLIAKGCSFIFKAE